MSLAGLALGGLGQNKQRIVSEGSMRPLIDLIKFPDREVQLAAVIAVNCIVLGPESNTKSMVLSEGGLIPILTLLTYGTDLDNETGKSAVDADMVSCVIYALGSLSEHEDVKAKLVELNSIQYVVRQYHISESLGAVNATNSHLITTTSNMIDIKRAVGYFLAGICEQMAFHDTLYHQDAFEVIISLATLEDIECQEYAAFCLAHLASNKEYQVPLVNLGAVRPLVTMLSSDAEPKHYAGLALLKLADNFENHLKIAEAGGIQALLRLGRTRSSDEQLQYKAALSVGQLATNAVRLLPSQLASTSFTNQTMNRSAAFGDRAGASVIGHGTRMLSRIRNAPDLATERQRLGGELVNSYLENSIQTPSAVDVNATGRRGSDRASRLRVSASVEEIPLLRNITSIPPIAPRDNSTAGSR